MKMSANILPAIATPDIHLQESQLNTYSQPSTLTDRCSQNDLFRHLVGKLEQTGSTFENLQKEFFLLVENSRMKSLKTFSTNCDEEYSDILSKKGELVDKLALSIEDLSLPVDCPQYRIQCYQGLSLEFKKQYNETKEEAHNYMNTLKKLEVEFQLLNSPSTVIMNHLNEENDPPNDQEIYRVKETFNEAKADLETVLNALHPNKVKQEFTQVMGILTGAYVSNIANEEEQFVKLTASAVRNVGIHCLLQEYVIIPHPSIPQMYRLCVDTS